MASGKPSVFPLRRSLSPRHQKRLDELAEKYDRSLEADTAFRKGFSKGFETAMRTMYPDAETMFAEDAQATEMVLTAIALREMADAD